MLIDLHNHTRHSSVCSLLSAQDLIERAMAVGLDGVCVTEHQVIEGANVAQKVGRRYGFPVFRGVEAHTTIGDILVYGYYYDIPEGTDGVELCRTVADAVGVAVMAHPFRSRVPALGRYLERQGLPLDENLVGRPELSGFTAIETLNSQCTGGESEKAQRLADILGLPGVGGSDSHALHMVGRCATRFQAPIRSDEELVAALKSGQYKAVRLRG